MRKPLWTKAWAAAVVSPRRSHALDASQYSSKDEALRLMDKLRSLETDAVLPANYFTPRWPEGNVAHTHEAVIDVAADAAVPLAADADP
jgi:hypothetical protein